MAEQLINEQFQEYTLVSTNSKEVKQIDNRDTRENRIKIYTDKVNKYILLKDRFITLCQVVMNDVKKLQPFYPKKGDICYDPYQLPAFYHLDLNTNSSTTLLTNEDIQVLLNTKDILQTIEDELNRMWELKFIEKFDGLKARYYPKTLKNYFKNTDDIIEQYSDIILQLKFNWHMNCFMESSN